jgi:bifunctional UDP-N-acetylglucosamine pyrophosphorylase / glucosamine-1-phosphate N-acetyltransferase
MAKVLKLEDQSESTNPVSLNGQMAIVILTAGRGSRMRSRTPKVQHRIAGLPMVEHVVRAAESLSPRQIILVTGPASEVLNAVYRERFALAWQEEPLGTGHAVASALDALEPDIEWVMVVFGDHPMTDTLTLQQVVSEIAQRKSLATLVAVELTDPGAYARFRLEDGLITGVVEARDDDTDYRGNTLPVLVNSGICCFRRAWLEQELPNIPLSASGEYYLTSLIEVAASSGYPDPVAHVVGSPETAFGVNTRVELADAERILRARINRGHMLAGVTMVDPDSTYVEVDVSIGTDTIIEPGVIIRRGTRIGQECLIGRGSILDNSEVGDRVQIISSTVESSVIDDDVDVGPYAHLRAGTRISSGTHIGNYVETKNATIGSDTAIGHFSYLGDAEIGNETNVGAGTITCNFDGVRKHRTVIGNSVFLGSDTLLVAPVEIGDGSRTGAGSVVTKNVPPGATVVGIPARMIRQRSEEQD